jgi:hypothetical protein
MIRAALGASCVVAALTFASRAWADGAELVTVVKPARGDAWLGEATTRLAAELKSAGFQVKIDKTAEGISADRVATIAIVATSRGAEADVWVSDGISDDLRVRRIIETDTTSPNAASDLAVRSVELLRASLMKATPAERQKLSPKIAAWLDEVHAPELAPPSVTKPPAASARVVARSPPNVESPNATPSEMSFVTEAPKPETRNAEHRTISVEAGLGFLTSPGSGVAFLPVIARAGLELSHGFGVRVGGASALSVTRTEGTASVAVRQSFVTAEATYDFASPRARLVPRASLGAGLYLLEADGRAKSPYFGLHPRFAGALVDGGVGVAVRIRPGVAIAADLSALLLEPEPAVTARGVTIFHTGRPAAFGVLGVEAHF